MPELTNKAEVRVISPEGHLRMGDKVDWLRSEVDSNLKAGYARLVVDMTRVTSIDSSAIGVLVRSLSLSKQNGGTVKLAGVPSNAAQVMKVTGVFKLFESFPDSSQALSSFA
jgi:anti-anti-sigma factor